MTLIHLPVVVDITFLILLRCGQILGEIVLNRNGPLALDEVLRLIRSDILGILNNFYIGIGRRREFFGVVGKISS